MRVLFWTPEFWPGIGGVEVLAAKLLPALRARGFEFIVVTPAKPGGVPDNDCYKGMPVYRFPFKDAASYNDIGSMVEVRRRVADLKRVFAPDLIHLNSLDIGDFFHLTTVQAHPCPWLVTVHGDWPRPNGKPNSLAQRALAGAAWVAACSEAMLRTARGEVPEIVARSSVIYNGRELSLPEPPVMTAGPPVVLCVGRLAREKGFDLALRAFAVVQQAFPDTRLVLVGDGPARAELEQEARQLGIDAAVRFMGWIEPDGVADFIRAATVVVVPSRWEEPFCLVALEAALLARPVVAAAVGGLPEVVVDGETGILVAREDSRAFADAIVHLLANPDAGVRMGRAGQSRAREKFGWSRFVDAYEGLYRTLITGVSPVPQ